MNLAAAALVRAQAAAARLLTHWAVEGHDRPVQVEIAAWLLAAAGARLPAMASRRLGLHAELAARLARTAAADALGWLDGVLADPDAETLLVHACHWASTTEADALVGLAERHRGRWFDGRMLARTTRPLRLLALFDGQPALGHATATVAELLIHGRDQGSPVAAAETRWAALAADPVQQVQRVEFRNAWLRITARESLAAAAELLDEMADDWGSVGLDEGATAVLARRGVADAAAAAAQVAARPETEDRAAWLAPLCWGFELPAAAVGLTDELLARSAGDPALARRVAAALAAARAPAALQKALAQADAEPALAQALVDGCARLRAAGHHDAAEAVREQLVQRLGSMPMALDLHDMLSAPGLPALRPWGHGAQLP